MFPMRSNRERPKNPLGRIAHVYEDYKRTNDILLENYRPNDDYTLEYLKNRGARLEGALAAIRYAERYVETKCDDIPDPPWEKED